jgi:hypothetical protein
MKKLAHKGVNFFLNKVKFQEESDQEDSKLRVTNEDQDEAKALKHKRR